jgi:MFS family permease
LTPITHSSVSLRSSSRDLSLRWVAVSVFLLSSTLNYFDRQLLNTLAPLIMLEFHLNLTGFGVLLSTFSIAYAASTLGAGWVLDRFGVNRGISVAVAWWSAASASTGLAGSLDTGYRKSKRRVSQAGGTRAGGGRQSNRAEPGSTPRGAGYRLRAEAGMALAIFVKRIGRADLDSALANRGAGDPATVRDCDRDGIGDGGWARTWAVWHFARA